MKIVRRVSSFNCQGAHAEFTVDGGYFWVWLPLRRIRLNCLRFEFCPEVTAKLLRAGYRIHEAPISYNPRGILEGKKIRRRNGVQVLWTMLRYRLPSLSSVLATALATGATNLRAPKSSLGGA